VAQTLEVKYWDDPAHAQGKWVPADVAVTVTVEVTAINPDPAAAALARKIVTEMELSGASLEELLGDKVLGPWVKFGHKPAGRRAPDRAEQIRTVTAQRKDMRAFADALDRGKEYLDPAWTPDKGSRNKYRYQPELERDYGAWVAAGRPVADGRPDLTQMRDDPADSNAA
jgi:hypothetical protein